MLSPAESHLASYQHASPVPPSVEFSVASIGAVLASCISIALCTSIFIHLHSATGHDLRCIRRINGSRQHRLCSCRCRMGCLVYPCRHPILTAWKMVVSPATCLDSGMALFFQTNPFLPKTKPKTYLNPKTPPKSFTLF